MIRVMGKLQGLCPCNFQGNSKKLGASIFRVFGKLQAYGLQFLGELLETGASIIRVIRKLQAYGLQFSGELIETGDIHNLGF